MLKAEVRLCILVFCWSLEVWLSLPWEAAVSLLCCGAVWWWWGACGKQYVLAAHYFSHHVFSLLLPPSLPAEPHTESARAVRPRPGRISQLSRAPDPEPAGDPHPHITANQSVICYSHVKV